MPEDFTRYDQIERYLNGEMTAHEKASFEEVMAADPGLKEEVWLSQQAREAIVDHNLIELKQKLTTFQPKKTFNWKKWGGIGLAFISIGVLVYSIRDTDPSNKIPTQPKLLHEKTSQHVQKDTTKQNEPTTQKTVVKRDEKSETKDIEDDAKRIKEKVIRASEDSSSQFKDAPPIASKNEKENKEPAPSINFTSCANFKLEIDILKKNTCKGLAKGIITVKSVSGGTPPYSYSIDADHYQTDNQFKELKADSYTLVVKDKNDCIDIADIIIEEELCGPDYVKAFNPDAGEIWEIPYDSDKSGIFKVMNRKNQLVYSHTFSGQEPKSWNGQGTTGALLPMGYYIFELIYEDGKTFGGGLSIIR